MSKIIQITTLKDSIVGLSDDGDVFLLANDGECVTWIQLSPEMGKEGFNSVSHKTDIGFPRILLKFKNIEDFNA